MHIRYEDNSTLGRPFAIGITIRQFSAQTTDERGLLHFDCLSQFFVRRSDLLRSAGAWPGHVQTRAAWPGRGLLELASCHGRLSFLTLPRANPSAACLAYSGAICRRASSLHACGSSTGPKARAACLAATRAAADARTASSSRSRAALTQNLRRQLRRALRKAQTVQQWHRSRAPTATFCIHLMFRCKSCCRRKR